MFTLFSVLFLFSEFVMAVLLFPAFSCLRCKMMVLHLIAMVAFQMTEVLRIGGPGVAAVQEDGVVGIQTVRIDSAVVAGASDLTMMVDGASDLTMIVGQRMTGQVVGENQTAPHPLAAAPHLTVAVAHHHLVAGHHPSAVGTGKLLISQNNV
jgi:hypothetical protein